MLQAENSRAVKGYLSTKDPMSSFRVVERKEVELLKGLRVAAISSLCPTPPAID